MAERAQTLAPEARLGYIVYAEPDQVKAYFEEDATPLNFDEIYLDPWTGQELGRRRRGDLSQGLINLMPFIYSLHWRLAMGDFGQWLLGIIAIMWTIDCFCRILSHSSEYDLKFLAALENRLADQAWRWIFSAQF